MQLYQLFSTFRFFLVVNANANVFRFGPLVIACRHAGGSTKNGSRALIPRLWIRIIWDVDPETRYPSLDPPLLYAEWSVQILDLLFTIFKRASTYLRFVKRFLEELFRDALLVRSHESVVAMTAKLSPIRALTKPLQ